MKRLRSWLSDLTLGLCSLINSVQCTPLLPFCLSRDTHQKSQAVLLTLGHTGCALLCIENK